MRCEHALHNICGNRREGEGSKHVKKELWMYNMEVPKPNKLGFRESMVRMMALIMGNSTQDVHFLDS